jgi:hypothetical protein
LPGVNPVGNEYEFPITDLADDMTKIIKHYGDNLKSVRNAAPSLETIFLDLTK